MGTAIGGPAERIILALLVVLRNKSSDEGALTREGAVAMLDRAAEDF
jgi:hypothetical protein